MKNITLQFLLLVVIITAIACKKEDTLVAVPEPEIKLSYFSFKQDTIPVTLSITTARKENVGTLYTTAVEGKLPDTILRKNNLIIRVTGDSARLYKGSEILASYTDSLGVTYSNSTSDTTNKVTITKLQKIKQGIVEGNFTIRVSNTTKTKTFLLTEGKFSTSFLD